MTILILDRSGCLQSSLGYPRLVKKLYIYFIFPTPLFVGFIFMNSNQSTFLKHSYFKIWMPPELSGGKSIVIGSGATRPPPSHNLSQCCPVLCRLMASLSHNVLMLLMLKPECSGITRSVVRVYTMVADALALYVIRPSATTILIIQYKRAHVYHQERFSYERLLSIKNWHKL